MTPEQFNLIMSELKKLNDKIEVSFDQVIDFINGIKTTEL